MVQKTSGKFEIMESTVSIVSGSVRVPTNVSHEMVALEPPKPNANEDLIELSSQDIYKYFQLCGYEYQELFCGLVCADHHGEYHCMLYFTSGICLSSLAWIHIVLHNSGCSHMRYLIDPMQGITSPQNYKIRNLEYEIIIASLWTCMLKIYKLRVYTHLVSEQLQKYDLKMQKGYQFCWTFLVTYSEAKLKSSGVKHLLLLSHFG
jgi:hypothetical protein